MAKAIVRVLAMIYYPSDYLDSEPIDSEWHCASGPSQ
jgi:hypothetical protein